MWNAVDTGAASSADSISTHTHKDHSFPSLLDSRVKCHTKGGIVWNSVALMVLFSKPAHTQLMTIFLVARIPLQMQCVQSISLVHRLLTIALTLTDSVCLCASVCLSRTLWIYLCVCPGLTEYISHLCHVPMSLLGIEVCFHTLLCSSDELSINLCVYVYTLYVCVS